MTGYLTRKWSACSAVNRFLVYMKHLYETSNIMCRFSINILYRNILMASWNISYTGSRISLNKSNRSSYRWMMIPYYTSWFNKASRFGPSQSCQICPASLAFSFRPIDSQCSPSHAASQTGCRQIWQLRAGQNLLAWLNNEMSVTGIIIIILHYDTSVRPTERLSRTRVIDVSLWYFYVKADWRGSGHLDETWMMRCFGVKLFESALKLL